jgi:hypothetical protein
MSDVVVVQYTMHTGVVIGIGRVMLVSQVHKLRDIQCLKTNVLYGMPLDVRNTPASEAFLYCNLSFWIFLELW